MNREIKFRGKKLKDNSWVYGLLTNDMKGHYRINFDPKIFSCVVKDDTIGQFTGLQDKNEKEIYEDDIMQITTALDKYLFKVTWNEELGAWCLMMKGYIKEGTKPLGEWLGEYWDKIEVIGNIYDNPELMEEWI